MSDSQVTTLDTAPQGTTDKAAGKAAAKAADSVKVKASGHDDQLSGKKVNLTIHQGHGDMGKLTVDVTLNGYLYRIPRGVAVDVPVEVKEILDHAVEAQYEPVDDKRSDFTVVEVPRFAVSSRG